jgi:general secretion pathway protein G
MRHRTVLGIVVLLAVASLAPAAAPPEPDGGLALASHLPRDPLAAWVVSTGNLAELWDRMLATIRRFVPEDETASFDQGLRSIDAQLGLSLRDDLLAHLGPEVAASVTLPPVDAMAGMVMTGSPAGIQTALGGVGLVVNVQDRGSLEGALRTLLEKAGAELGEQGSLQAARFPMSDEEGAPRFTVLYGFRDQAMAIGFSPEWVTAALEPRPAGQRLADGADFARVRGHLDAAPDGLLYVNLPALREMLLSSQMARGAMAGKKEMQPLVTFLEDPDFVTMGYGASVKLDHGVSRRVSVGPPWVAGSGAVAIVAAIAIPNMINAVNRAREKRTLADMRTLGMGLETFFVETGAYPATGGEWVDAATLAPELVPEYLQELPAADAWEHPLRYRSDGVSYQLVSPGRDGELEQDWSEPGEPGPTTGLDADIVFTDGSFVRWPEGMGP